MPWTDHTCLRILTFYFESLRVPDEGHSRKASCILNLISTFLLDLATSESGRVLSKSHNLIAENNSGDQIKSTFDMNKNRLTRQYNIGAINVTQKWYNFADNPPQDSTSHIYSTQYRPHVSNIIYHIRDYFCSCMECTYKQCGQQLNGDLNIHMIIYLIKCMFCLSRYS
jgi:hypothetical protein